jgi:hypothetical protein
LLAASLLLHAFLCPCSGRLSASIRLHNTCMHTDALPHWPP